VNARQMRHRRTCSKLKSWRRLSAIVLTYGFAVIHHMSEEGKQGDDDYG
jgi:hypothetical protein